MNEFIGKMVVIRDNRAGIHVGVLRSCNLAAKIAVLAEARKVWYWEGAASCHGIAAKGLCHKGSKVAPPVPLVASADVVEVVLCTPEGAESVRTCPVWGPEMPEGCDNGSGDGLGNGIGYGSGYGSGSPLDKELGHCSGYGYGCGISHGSSGCVGFGEHAPIPDR